MNIKQSDYGMLDRKFQKCIEKMFYLYQLIV